MEFVCWVRIARTMPSISFPSGMNWTQNGEAVPNGFADILPGATPIDTVALVCVTNLTNKLTAEIRQKATIKASSLAPRETKMFATGAAQTAAVHQATAA